MKTSLLLDQDLTDLEEYSYMVIKGYINIHCNRWIPSSIVVLIGKFIDAYNIAFISACSRNDVKMVNDFISIIPDKINIDDENIHGITPVCVAASLNNNFELMRLLIKNGADINKQCGINGDTALCIACQCGNKLSVDLLLMLPCSDANIVRTKDNATPIMIATENGYLDIVDVLLKSGADPFHRNKSGQNAFILAVIKGDLSIVTLIHKHVCKMNTDIQKKILLNLADNTNKTALHYGCINGDYNVMKYLIQNTNIDRYKKDDKGRIPINYASINGDKNIVSLFL